MYPVSYFRDDTGFNEYHNHINPAGCRLFCRPMTIFNIPATRTGQLQFIWYKDLSGMIFIPESQIIIFNPILFINDFVNTSQLRTLNIPDKRRGMYHRGKSCESFVNLWLILRQSYTLNLQVACEKPYQYISLLGYKKLCFAPICTIGHMIRAMHGNVV